MKFWIFGDSFSSSNDKDSWVNKLGAEVRVTSFNGSSEYRIWRNYQDNKHLINSSDYVIFCHTSSSRVFLKDDAESLTRTLETHPSCDLLFNNVYSNNETKYIDILENIWDERYFTDTFNLLVNDLKSVPNSTHITFFESDNIQSLYHIWQLNKGNINHMNENGNRIASEFIKKSLTGHKRIVSFGASMAAGQGLDNVRDAYPYIIADRLNLECDNTAKPGASNLEILHDILNYKFEEGDVALLMWAPCNRDLIFGKKNGSIGAWQQTELVKNWALTHTDHDLTVRTWYHIHHALLYLHSINIPYYNFAGYARPINVHKPPYMKFDLIDSGIDTFKRQTPNTSDGHPGPEGHKLVAERLLGFIV
jgi:lysophospholipase L1-like esterase